jgi:hypothetical protein
MAQIAKGVYWTPPVPGGIAGQSAALAYAQGARTPGEIASQGIRNYFGQVFVVIIVVAIIIFLKFMFSTPPPPKKEKFKNRFLDTNVRSVKRPEL